MNSKKSSKFLTTFVSLLSLYLLITEVSTEEMDEVNIICSTVGNVNWSVIGEVYSCYNLDATVDLVTTPNAEVTSITHSNGSMIETVDEIEALSLQNMRMNYIPNSIKKKLPKLRAIQFVAVSLSSINKKSMHQFGDSLEILNFPNNKLTSLEEDSFENNLNLKYIGLRNNPITHIDPNFFETLKNMKNIRYVYMSDLSCMSQNFDKASHGDIATFEWKNSGCFDETCDSCLVKYLDDSTQQINNNVNRTIRELADDINNVKESLANMDSGINRRMDLLDQKLDEILKFLNV